MEVEFLDAEQAVPAPLAPDVPGDERVLRAVLVVAGEADFRGYVRECLRERTDLRLLEAASVTAAIQLAAYDPPDLVVVDQPEREVLVTLAERSAIVIVDDVPHDAAGAGTRVRLLARPFSGERLIAEVGRLLG